LVHVLSDEWGKPWCSKDVWSGKEKTDMKVKQSFAAGEPDSGLGKGVRQEKKGGNQKTRRRGEGKKKKMEENVRVRTENFAGKRHRKVDRVKT